MVADSDGIRPERDNDLVLGFADRSRGLLQDYNEWIYAEIKDLQAKIEAIQATTNGTLSVELEVHTRELEIIEQHRFPEAKRNLRQKCSEIEGGTYDNIMDANQWIQDGLNRFESLARSVLSIRKEIDRVWGNEH